MDYTHVHIIHDQSKNSSTKIKQCIDLANKGNQKLYLPVKNKTKTQTGKQNQMQLPSGE